MFKLINLHPRLRVITTAISSSSTLLSLSIYFCLLAIMICGSALYYIERLSDPMHSQIISVIDGMWLALTTICTVGYGDTVPVSFAGMVFGAITTVLGVLIIDLPMPIINSIFDNYNRHLIARQQLPKQRRRITPAVIPRKIQPLMPPKRQSHSHSHQT
jgi:voltage-gated potassium channel Kch